MQLENEKLYTYIYEQVEKAGIFPHILGCKYIAYAVYLILHDQPLMYQTMLLYAKIASQYDTTSTAVEHCIRHAIFTAYRSHTESVEKIVKVSSQQPKNSEFICTLAEKIRLKLMVEQNEWE